MPNPPPEPTQHQCSNNTELTWPGSEGTEHRGTACWYPRMGGYHGKAVAEVDGDGCVDVYVWHNGEFPFGTELNPERPPVELHHCEGDGFVRFGYFLEKLVHETWQDPDQPTTEEVNSGS